MSKSSAFSFTVVVAALVLAVVLNPSPDRHREKIRQAIADRNMIDRILGVGVLTALASTYRSVGVASYTMVDGRIVSIGAYGMVLIVQ